MRQVLIAIDGSQGAKKALFRGGRIAARMGTHVHLLAVATPLVVPDLSEEEEERFRNQAVLETKLLLERAGASLGKMGVRPRVHFRLGDPAQEIVSCAREVRADLLVLGTRRLQGAKRFLLGSVSARVVELAPCSVLIVK